MNKLWSAAIGAAIVALAFVLNPTPEQHRAKIRSVISERSAVAKAFGVGALTAFVSTYSSLGVASYTTVNGRTVSLGAWKKASWFNGRHMQFAWASLIWVMVTDVYVRLVSHGVIHDFNTW